MFSGVQSATWEDFVFAHDAGEIYPPSVFDEYDNRGGEDVGGIRQR
jgi:hypothetical protein